VFRRQRASDCHGVDSARFCGRACQQLPELLTRSVCRNLQRDIRRSARGGGSTGHKL